MNELQKLLLLRGLSAATIASEIGINYHSTQKVIKGARHTQHVQEAIAKYLGMTREQAFGTQSAKHLGALIKAEIAKQQQALGFRLKSLYLPMHTEGIADSGQASNG